LANDEDFAGLEVIAADDAQPPESTPGPVTGPDMQKQRARHGQPDADMDDAISAATEPVTEEIHPKKKKDLVARMASIVARFTAIVAALLLITVVTNVLQQMQLAIEIEFAVHGATAVVLILLLYYVWIKTRIGD
jgi:hypothetical protein